MWTHQCLWGFRLFWLCVNSSAPLGFQVVLAVCELISTSGVSDCSGCVWTYQHLRGFRLFWLCVPSGVFGFSGFGSEHCGGHVVLTFWVVLLQVCELISAAGVSGCSGASWSCWTSPCWLSSSTPLRWSSCGQMWRLKCRWRGTRFQISFLLLPSATPTSSRWVRPGFWSGGGVNPGAELFLQLQTDAPDAKDKPLTRMTACIPKPRVPQDQNTFVQARYANLIPYLWKLPYSSTNPYESSTDPIKAPLLLPLCREHFTLASYSLCQLYTTNRIETDDAGEKFQRKMPGHSGFRSGGSKTWKPSADPGFWSGVQSGKPE